jgi:hypothetical protein
MDQFKTITWSSQHDCMVTNDIPPAHSMDANFVPSTLTRHAGTPVTGILLVIKVIDFIQHFD